LRKHIILYDYIKRVAFKGYELNEVQTIAIEKYIKCINKNDKKIDFPKRIVKMLKAVVVNFYINVLGKAVNLNYLLISFVYYMEDKDIKCGMIFVN
jgi:hypothetical protein